VGFFEKMHARAKGFVPLDKAMQRLEKKAESLRLQFLLFQQEESTRKINVLTIIQAIFVPLTFIGGVYGMNFVNIPELKLEYGYLYVWVLFVGLASALLTYFYKKGWFD
jgi:magnesium transporter